jgi:hypothetical protein
VQFACVEMERYFPYSSWDAPRDRDHATVYTNIRHVSHGREYTSLSNASGGLIWSHFLRSRSRHGLRQHSTGFARKRLQCMPECLQRVELEPRSSECSLLALKVNDPFRYSSSCLLRSRTCHSLHQHSTVFERKRLKCAL